MDKSPAFQWYPKDYLTDERVIAMSLEEEGAYRRLMDHCWLHGSLPDDLKILAGILKNPTKKRMKSIWAAVSPCFENRGGRWHHPRLDKERKKQEDSRLRRSKAGRKGAEKRWQPDGNANSNAIGTPMARDGLPSPTPTPTPVHDTSARAEDQATDDSVLLEHFNELVGQFGGGNLTDAEQAYFEHVPRFISPDDLLTARRRYCESKSDPRYWRHLGRWIRGREYDDPRFRPESDDEFLKRVGAG